MRGKVVRTLASLAFRAKSLAAHASSHLPAECIQRYSVTFPELLHYALCVVVVLVVTQWVLVQTVGEPSCATKANCTIRPP